MNWKYIREVIKISLIQDFEADFLWKVSLKILNSRIILKTFTHAVSLEDRNTSQIHSDSIQTGMRLIESVFEFRSIFFIRTSSHISIVEVLSQGFIAVNLVYKQLLLAVSNQVKLNDYFFLIELNEQFSLNA